MKQIYLFQIKTGNKKAGFIVIYTENLKNSFYGQVTFAPFVTTFTTLNWAIRKMVSSREHRLKTFLKIGFAHYAELEKKNLRKRPKTLSFLLHHCLLPSTFTT